MTKLQIISKQWSLIYDLLLFDKGESKRTLEDIEQDMDILEFECRKYVGADDEELMMQKGPR